MDRLRGLAREALMWPFLEDEQRLLWAAVLEFDAVPTQELPPWFFERHNFTRRRLGVDLFSLDGQRAILCRAGNATGRDVKRFLRTAKCLFEAPCCTLWTLDSYTISADSQKWLHDYGGQRKIVTKMSLRQRAAASLKSGHTPTGSGHLPAPPLRPCQEACLEACAKGARVIEMACGTGKTRVIRELAAKQPGKVLVIVPSRVLLEQFAREMPGFCKVGTIYNDKIDMASRGFIAVADSVHLLRKLMFEAIFVDEAHHPLPSKLPDYNKLFKFSATHKENVDFRYSLGQAISQGVLCDYDLTVPVTTEGHPYICLANLLLSQSGRFRRVLAYCNSIAEAKRFQQVLETVGVAAWHINGHTSRKGRERVMNEFSGKLQKAVHVLVTVQVLGEGINIPNADTCMFVEPRSSYVSIIQVIGRVLRPHLAKPMAHVVLPAIVMPAAPATTGTAQRGLSDSRGATSRTEDGLVASAGPAGASHSAGCEDVQDIQVQKSPTLPARVMPREGDSGGSMESGPTVIDSSVPHSEHVLAPSEMQSGDGSFKLRRSESAKTNGARAQPEPGGIQEKGRTHNYGESLATSKLQGYESSRHIVSEANVQLGSQGGSNSRAKPEDHGSSAPAVIESQYRAVEIPDKSLAVDDSGLVHDSELSGPPRRSSGELTAVVASGSATRRSNAAFSRSVVPQADSASLSLGHASSQKRCRHEQLHGPQARQTPTARKLKVNGATGDMSMLWSGKADQLGRFLGAIARADSRFAADDARHLQSRFWVADCRLQHSMTQQLLHRSVLYRLALILQQHDPWDLRLREVEQFVLDHDRLPRGTAGELRETRLATWLQQTGVKIKKQLLPATRMQKLLNSSGRLVARVAKWRDPETPFEQCLKELRQFVRAHHRIPKHWAKDHDERVLARRLNTLVKHGHGDRERRLRLLEKESPIVATWAMSIRTRKLAISENLWMQGFQSLVEFVETHGRMPRSRRAEEKAVYVWLCRQRRLLDSLPAELRTALFDSHPAVASFLQS
ncbi:unnamed protein product [Symbiodinium microadriaticum]|nr:unnamed protein product [Symbiodinium microadriaticum]CAE7922415.1 unnamed protein product [Symbiodinium sp. KB8]